MSVVTDPRATARSTPSSTTRPPRETRTPESGDGVAGPDDAQVGDRARRAGAEGLAQAGRLAAGVADRQGRRRPSDEAREPHDGRVDLRAQHRLGGVEQLGHVPLVDEDDAVGVVHDPLEPVLGQHDRDPEVVHDAMERGQDLFCGNGIQRRRRLVEHEHPRAGGEEGGDRDTLLLATREGAQRPRAQRREPEEVEGLLDAAADRRRVQTHRLHAVGDLVLDDVRDERRRRVLLDEPDDGREVARSVLGGVESVDGDAARQRAAAEVRHEPVDGAQQRRLAAARGTDDEDELALGDLERDVVEAGSGGAGILHRHVLEGDHGATSRGRGVNQAGDAATSGGEDREQGHGGQLGPLAAGRCPPSRCAEATTRTAAGTAPATTVMVSVHVHRSRR